MTAQNLTAFVDGLNVTNVTDGTNSAKGHTYFCPVNAAFTPFLSLTSSNSSNGTTGNFTIPSSGPGSLLATLTRHGFNGSIYSSSLRSGALLHTQDGYPVLVTVQNGSTYLNDAKVVGANAITNNGAVHVLDRVTLSRKANTFYHYLTRADDVRRVQVMGYLNTSTNETTPANATQYANPANIPTPTNATSSATSGATGTSQPTPPASTSKRAAAPRLRVMGWEVGQQPQQHMWGPAGVVATVPVLLMVVVARVGLV